MNSTHVPHLHRWLARQSTGLAVAVLACLSIAGCQMIAVGSAEPKTASVTRTQDALDADALFWSDFHAGDYMSIPTVLTALDAAYLKDPHDSTTAAHIGWMHIWKLSESARVEHLGPEITDEATLSKEYFSDAVQMKPDDARYVGFLASAMLAEGSIHKDEKETRRGYFLLRDAIDAYPEFNLFTGGYVMSNAPVGSSQFAEALQWQWKNLDVCAGEPVSRTHPDFSKYFSQETHTGPNRVCWDSSIAPYNFEGFFLNMGDMLVKSGDWQTALLIYANAQKSPTYASWPYRGVLEARIANAQSNVDAFRSTVRVSGAESDRRLMINTRFSCMGCHQS